MGSRLKTSKKTKEIFEQLGKSSNLKPFALCKIAIALSLQAEEGIDAFKSDQFGLELQRPTVTGEFDALYKCLIEDNIGGHLSDDGFFPHYIKKHIDRGSILLLESYKYSGGNLEKFLNQLLIRGDELI